jgi:putative iron-dependent peroxidase
MAQPQAGIIPEPSSAALFVILRVRQPGKNGGAVAQVAAGIPALAQKVGSVDKRANLVCTVSFGSKFWDTFGSSRGRPMALRPFKALRAGRRCAPSTGGDVLLHIISARHDLNFELAMRIKNLLAGMVEVMDEVRGFRYLDNRDLTGFIDGTENPKGTERGSAALVGKEDPAFAGGSYVFTQRYVHNLGKWDRLSQKEQEKVVGRTKQNSKELSDHVKPATSHVSRNVIEENGKELKIVRHSFPYGTTSESGLFFIAYSKSPDIPEKMLLRMVGTSGDRLHDRLLDFSRAVTGANFFAPSLNLLKTLGKWQR